MRKVLEIAGPDGFTVEAAEIEIGTLGDLPAAAVEAFAALTGDFPQRAQYRWEHGMAELAAAGLPEQRHDSDAARHHHELAIGSHQTLARLAPHRIDTAREPSVMHGNPALALEHGGDPDGARREFDPAIVILLDLARATRRRARSPGPRPVALQSGTAAPKRKSSMA